MTAFDNITKDPSMAERAGVYCIENTKTKHRYVGATVNLRVRAWNQRGPLNRGQHWIDDMQSEWDKFGSQAFRMYVIEFCEEEDLADREQHWIDTLEPEFNIGKCADRPMLGIKHRPESVAAMRENRRGKGTGPHPWVKPPEGFKKGHETWNKGMKMPAAVGRKISQRLRDRYKNGEPHPNSKKIEVDGQVFVNQKAAAKVYGVSPNTVTRWVQRGTARRIAA